MIFERKRTVYRLSGPPPGPTPGPSDPIPPPAPGGYGPSFYPPAYYPPPPPPPPQKKKPPPPIFSFGGRGGVFLGVFWGRLVPPSPPPPPTPRPPHGWCVRGAGRRRARRGLP